MLNKPYGDVKEDFLPGTLNFYWKYLCGFRNMIEGEHASHCFAAEFDVLQKTRSALVRYSVCQPWPPASAGYSPEYFKCKFFAHEFENFYYLLGMAQGYCINVPDEAWERLTKDAEDIEAEIIKSCLERYAEHEARKQVMERAYANTVASYLSLHVGEHPTHKEMSAALGMSTSAISKIISGFKADGRLVMDKKRNIVRFDDKVGHPTDDMNKEE